MINPENYLSKIKEIDINSMPTPLQKGHEFLMKATSNGTDWNTYNNSTPVRKTIQLYFERLNDFLPKPTEVSSSKKLSTTKSNETANNQSTQPSKPRKQKAPPEQIPDVILVERM